MALSITLTLAFRPVGAFIFGLLADRYGRRLPLIIDLIFYSIFEVLTGLAPNYSTFLLFRALFGIGMGGEWGVGAALAMEQAPPRFRGLLSGLLQEGYATGYLLAALCSRFVLDAHGWRPLFFIGGLPALLALFVRLGVKESPVWERTSAHQNWKQTRRAILSQWKIFVYLAILMTVMNLASHGTQDLYPSFLRKQWSYDTARASATTVISMIGAIAGGVAFGLVSDRRGRRKSMVIAFVLGFLLVPFWALSPAVARLLPGLSPALLLYAGAFLMQFMVQGAWGVVPAHLTEMSPGDMRGFMPGFAYQCGVLVASPVVYCEDALAAGRTYAFAMALTAAMVFVVGTAVIALGRERKGLQF